MWHVDDTKKEWCLMNTAKPITIKERVSMVFLEKGELDVIDGAFVLVDKNGVRTQIPVGGIALYFC
jgi:hypothetical protein